MMGGSLRALAAGLLLTAVLVPGHAASANPRCTVQGLVVDDEFVPLAGADVGLINNASTSTTTSGADGTFQFKKVDAGSYVLAATKLGFEAASQEVACVDGAAVEAVLVLVPIEEPVQFVQIFQAQGRIACSVGVYAISSTDLCRDTGLDPAARSIFRLSVVPEPITGAVYEMAWAPSSAPGSRCLSLNFPHVKSESATFTTDDELDPGPQVRGPSPIGLRIESPIDDPAYHRASPSAFLTFEVRAAGGDLEELAPNPLDACQSLLVFEQDFELHVALFYNGLAIPPGFTMLP